MKVTIENGWVNIEEPALDATGKPRLDLNGQPMASARSMTLAQYQKHVRDAAFLGAIAPADRAAVQTAIDAAAPSALKA